VLYTRGFPHDLKSKVVCMMLVSKTGQEKLVAFDRDTGDLIERFEIPTPTFSIPKSVAE
jgi:outer membrane protein assembly factor BamB